MRAVCGGGAVLRRHFAILRFESHGGARWWDGMTRCVWLSCAKSALSNTRTMHVKSVHPWMCAFLNQVHVFHMGYECLGMLVQTINDLCNFFHSQN